MTDNVTTPNPLPRLLTVKEVTQSTGYKAGTIYQMISKGYLASVKRSTVKQSRVWITEESFLAWYETLKVRNPIKTRNYNRRRKAA